MHYISVSLWTQRNLQCHYNSRERITEALLHLRESVHLNIKKKAVYFLHSGFFNATCRNAVDKSVLVTNFEPWNCCNVSCTGGMVALPGKVNLFMALASTETPGILPSHTTTPRRFRQLETDISKTRSCDICLIWQKVRRMEWVCNFSQPEISVRP